MKSMRLLGLSLLLFGCGGGGGGGGTPAPTPTTPAANQSPVAQFTYELNNITWEISVDASASRDPDGTISSYAWNFGDGTTGTGQTATHTYTRKKATTRSPSP